MITKEAISVLKALKELEGAGYIEVFAFNDGYDTEEFVSTNPFITEKGNVFIKNLGLFDPTNIES